MRISILQSMYIFAGCANMDKDYLTLWRVIWNQIEREMYYVIRDQQHETYEHIVRDGTYDEVFATSVRETCKYG
jgi:hypothetical protein